MMTDMTHFLDEVTDVLVDDVGNVVSPVLVTLCGLPVEAIILKDSREPDCQACSEVHKAEGWLFPLPAMVTATVPL